MGDLTHDSDAVLRDRCILNEEAAAAENTGEAALLKLRHELAGIREAIQEALRDAPELIERIAVCFANRMKLPFNPQWVI